MKIIFIVFSISSLIYAQSWENISPFAPGNNLQSITKNEFDNSLWICGDDGIIAKSMDHGASWQYFYNSLGDYSYARQIIFISENEAICIANLNNIRTIPNKSMVYKSYDKCSTWNIVYNGVNEIYSVDFLDNQIGFIAGRNTLKTTNGGESWIELNYTMKQIEFLNSDILYGIRDSSILKSNDLGSNWDIIYQKNKYKLETFHWSDNTKCLVSVNKNEDWSPNDWSSIILQTSDGGLNWNEFDFGNTMQNNIVSVNSFFSNNTSTIWGACQLDEIVKFNANGSGWSVLRKGNNSSSRSIIVDEDNIITVGENGSITKSTDNGETWITISNGKKEFYDVQFLDEMIGYAIGRLIKENNYFPVMIKSIDGGNNWDELELPIDGSYDIIQICSLNEQNIFLVVNKRIGSRSKIFKTTNGGEEWDKIYDVDITGEQLKDIQFLDENFGVAVGEKSTIVKTTNGGINWEWTTRTNSTSLLKVSIINKNLMFFGGVGFNSFTNEFQFQLYKTEDGALTYKSISSNISSIGRIGDVKDLLFFDENNGWVLLGYEVQNTGILYKTMDGGLSWERNYVSGNIYNNFTTINFLDFHNGYITMDGSIFSTIDGGDNWSETVIDNFPYRANSINFVSKAFGVIAGRNNLLLRITEDINTKLEDTKHIQLSHIQLRQNYPNPFNPATKIQYSIPVASVSSIEVQHVTLKIFDILGKEVTTLVKKKQPAGSYKVEFDGSSLPSGVYFYRLQVDNFIETKKMVLVR